DHRRVRVVERSRHLDAVGAGDALGEAAGDDRLRGEGLACRLVPRAAASALAAGTVVHEREASAVVVHHDLVAEHAARVSWGELLDVGPAQAARDDVDRVRRLWNLRELRLPARI